MTLELFQASISMFATVYYPLDYAEKRTADLPIYILDEDFGSLTSSKAISVSLVMGGGILPVEFDASHILLGTTSPTSPKLKVEGQQAF